MDRQWDRRWDRRMDWRMDWRMDQWISGWWKGAKRDRWLARQRRHAGVERLRHWRHGWR